MPPTPLSTAAPAEWVQVFDEALTRCTRAVRSTRLHALMGEQARVQLGEHLALTLTILGDSQPMRVSELAAHLDVERSTVSRRVTELVRLGLVTRAVDRNDRRAARLKLTRSGERTVAKLRKAWHKTLQDLTVSWPAKQRGEIALQLSKLASGLEALIGDETAVAS